MSDAQLKKKKLNFVFKKKINNKTKKKCTRSTLASNESQAVHGTESPSPEDGGRHLLAAAAAAAASEGPEKNVPETRVLRFPSGRRLWLKVIKHQQKCVRGWEEGIVMKTTAKKQVKECRIPARFLFFLFPTFSRLPLHDQCLSTWQSHNSYY